MKKNIICGIVFLALFTIVPLSVFAVGQMTKPIIFENVMRGQEMTEILLLSNGENQDAIFQLKGDGEIASWASFYMFDDKKLETPITEIAVPAKSGLKAIVKFSVPENTPNGKYTGEVAVTNAPAQTEQKDNVSVQLFQRVGRQVSITVTDKEIVNFQTTIIPLKYGVANGEPLIIKAIFDNQGNIIIKPNIQLKITQVSTGSIIHNAIYPYPDTESSVKPFERKEIEEFIKWPTAGQQNGHYTVDVKVLLNGTEMSHDDFNFEIGVSMLMVANMSNVAKLFGGDLTMLWFALAAVILAIGGAVAFLVKAKMSKSKA